jgi:hypothetical protein
VQDVGRHRAEYGDHDDGEPVDPGVIPAAAELQRHGGGKRREADNDRGLRIDPVNQVVRRRLPMPVVSTLVIQK